MKRNIINLMKRNLAIIILFLAFLFSPSLVKADYIQSTSDDVDTAGHSVFQILGTGLSGTINTATIGLQSTYGATVIFVEASTRSQLFQTLGSQNVAYADTYWSWVQYSSSTVRDFNDTASVPLCDGDSSGSRVCNGILLDSNKWYGFGVTSGDITEWHGSSANTWATSSENTCWNNGSGDFTNSSCPDTGYPTDITFALYTGSAITYPTVTLADPVTGYSGYDFTQWKLNFDTSEATEPWNGAWIGVEYQNVSSSSWTNAKKDYQVIYTAGEPIASNTSTTITKKFPLWYPPLATTTTWYARTFIEYGDATQEYSFYGDVQTFTIKQNPNQGINDWAYQNVPGLYSTSSDLIPGFDPTSTSTFTYGSSTIVCVDSETLYSAMGCYLKISVMAVISWLFEPPEAVSTQLTGSIDSLKGIFPFSIPLTILSTLKNQTDNVITPVYSQSIISLPQIGLETQLLSSTTLKDALENPLCDSTCATDMKNSIFQVERTIIWLGTAILAFIIIF